MFVTARRRFRRGLPEATEHAVQDLPDSAGGVPGLADPPDAGELPDDGGGLPQRSTSWSALLRLRSVP